MEDCKTAKGDPILTYKFYRSHQHSFLLFISKWIKTPDFICFFKTVFGRQFCAINLHTKAYLQYRELSLVFVALRQLSRMCPTAAICVWPLLMKRYFKCTWCARLGLQVGRRGIEAPTTNSLCGFLSNYLLLSEKEREITAGRYFIHNFKRYFVVKIVKSSKPRADRGKFMVPTLRSMFTAGEKKWKTK